MPAETVVNVVLSEKVFSFMSARSARNAIVLVLPKKIRVPPPTW